MDTRGLLQRQRKILGVERDRREADLEAFIWQCGFKQRPRPKMGEERRVRP